MNNHPSGVQRGGHVRITFANPLKQITGVVLSADNLGITIAFDPMVNGEPVKDTTEVDALGVPVNLSIRYVPWNTVGYVDIARIK